MPVSDQQLAALLAAVRSLALGFKADDLLFSGDASPRLPDTDLQALMFIGEPGPSTVNIVGSHLGLAPVTANRLVDRLARKGLVRRVRSDENRRVRHLILTAAGEAVRQAALAERMAHCRAMLEVLDPAERAAFIGLMTKVADRIERRNPAADRC